MSICIGNDIISFDRNAITKFGFPSDRYIELQKLSSGSTYIAPVDGYFCCNGIDPDGSQTTFSRAYIVLRNQTRYFGASCLNDNTNLSYGWVECFLPAKKNDTVFLYYITDAFNDTFKLRFYYAEGAF